MAAKKAFSAKLSDLTWELILCEVEELGGSQADALERMAIRAAGHSAKASQLVLEHLKKDPRAQAMIEIALGSGGFGDSPRKTKK